MGLQVCVPVGGGGFACQYVPNPPVGGAHVLTISGNPPVIFWGQRNIQPPLEEQATGDEPPWRTVKRVTRKRGKRKK